MISWEFIGILMGMYMGVYRDFIGISWEFLRILMGLYRDFDGLYNEFMGFIGICMGFYNDFKGVVW